MNVDGKGGRVMALRGRGAWRRKGKVGWGSRKKSKVVFVRVGKVDGGYRFFLQI